MAKFFSTKQAANLLQLRADTLSRAVWLGRIPAPTKGPGGAFLWTEVDIERAGWALLHRTVKVTGGASND